MNQPEHNEEGTAQLQTSGILLFGVNNSALARSSAMNWARVSYWRFWATLSPFHSMPTILDTSPKPADGFSFITRLRTSAEKRMYPLLDLAFSFGCEASQEEA